MDDRYKMSNSDGGDLQNTPMAERSQPSSRSGKLPSSCVIGTEVAAAIDSKSLCISTSFTQLSFPRNRLFATSAVSSTFNLTSSIVVVIVVAKIISSLEDDPDAVKEDGVSREGKLAVSSAGEVARISRKSDSIVASSTVL